ncbi:hypothetical protein [Pyrococcus kukulkanii]|uniref:Uncharacterized protein n=1 Tax=Pyrococcus kukulkanii TaxID=1609559 RepID=A0A127B946_9EURY|nr:hypothetical protein [Pyrococcus kukulkanii]AMM53890.1 hypothetical protein TQ32_04880 [Pyrococcus kukulkanii]
MRVAIITTDARVYYIAAKVLREHKIPFYSLRINEDIPFDVEIVLTSEKDYKRINFPTKIVVRDENFIDELLLKLEGKRKFESVYIAIDPGERPGVSVVADNRVLEVYHLKSPKDVDIIVQLLEKYPGAKIKIGHGAKRHRTLMLKTLSKILGDDYRVILVNEKGTTPRVGGIEAWAIQDIVASINIGLREGREVTIRELIRGNNVTKGEIENIKAQSRRLSGGKITISSELAREVALGNITIEEAIEIQKKKGEVRK